ncbi:response regulator transcription factor [Mucilaginibacter arboris]|uniref:Response regulator n=1 Tax=Mucilaginibacter arboris TaxID=2682090 RepID=A0A7K1STL8_9SPHI|nr:response regulator transcription factor [Mucilaginibacter arboris]MVN20652.1 response regulator [Mucilaginibacter arboris]
MAVINLAIADDHKIFREGLKATLEDCVGLNILFEAANGIELVKQLALKNPDIVLMDIKMPEMDGMEATTYIHEHFNHVKVLALSMFNEDKYILDIMKAGACGYLLKNAEPQEIIDAVFTVYKKGYYFNEHLSVTLIKQLMGKNSIHLKGKDETELNERETEILKLICQEKQNTEIADQLFLSVRTVEGYRTKLFEKTGSKNIVGLVIYAIKKGIIDV